MPLQSDSSSLPLPSLATAFTDLDTWTATIDDVERRGAGDASRIARYRELVASDDVQRLIGDVLTGRHVTAPPRRIELNKAGAKKKSVYQLQAEDELVSRVLNRLLQPRVAAAISPRCHSFQPNRSAITAFAALRATPGVDTMASLHIDIADFFNSIDVDDLLDRLPSHVSQEPVAMTFITTLLRDHRVICDGRLVPVPRKGVMAGTPLAPLLTNLYLSDIDASVAALEVASARYSDDMLVLGSQDQVDAAESRVRALLNERGLRVNEDKTHRGGPGEPWEFLGLRYSRGEVGLSANTVRKLRAKVRRRARRQARHRLATGCSAEVTCERLVCALNHKLYGTGSLSDAEFGWARWFFPLLSNASQLADLDASIQREIRWAACGSRRDRARSLVPYTMLRSVGYVPLVTAYHRQRERRHPDPRSGDPIRTEPSPLPSSGPVLPRMQPA
jgi:hypothetical protein